MADSRNIDVTLDDFQLVPTILPDPDEPVKTLKDVEDAFFADLLRTVEPVVVESTAAKPVPIEAKTVVATTPVPFNAMPAKMSITDIEDLAYQATLVPEVLEVARVQLGLTHLELQQVMASPVYAYTVEQAKKQIKADPMASVRLLARATLPDIVKQLHVDALSMRSDPRDRVTASKLLIELAEPPSVKTLAASGLQVPGGGVNLNINLGSSVGGLVARAQVVKSVDQE